VKAITLLTDFGLRDPYVGIMKGIIISINPEATVIDITHDVDPQDIREGAFFIEEYYRFFPKGTVHLAVVDPGVGSARRPVILVKDDCFFVGPDNGIFSLVMDEKPTVHALENQEYMRTEISSTFHGRDIFAPAAAHLSRGIAPATFGPPVTDPVRLEGLLPVMDGSSVLRGEVVRFDRFGNAITNIRIDILRDFTGDGPFAIRVCDMTFTALSRSYYESEFTCLTGSSGYLEFGCFKGSFSEAKGIAKGEPVLVEIS